MMPREKKSSPHGGTDSLQVELGWVAGGFRIASIRTPVGRKIAGKRSCSNFCGRREKVSIGTRTLRIPKVIGLRDFCKGTGI